MDIVVCEVCKIEPAAAVVDSPFDPGVKSVRVCWSCADSVMPKD